MKRMQPAVLHAFRGVVSSLRGGTLAYTITSSVLVALLGTPSDGAALECPAMPQQAQRDWDMEVAMAVGRVRELSGSQLQTRTRTITIDLLKRLPNADRVYLEQMMYATYCSSLRDNATLSEEERNVRIRAYNREVRSTLGENAPPISKVDPRDVARADLARRGVEYTPKGFLDNAMAGDTDVVRLFLQAGFDPNTGDMYGTTALMWAARQGNVPMMESLLKARAGLGNLPNMFKTTDTALDWAASAGKLDAMQLLLKSGASKQSIDDALKSAARDGRVEAMRVLMKAGASKESYARAFPSAVESGSVEAARLLLDQGVSVRGEDGYRGTAINEIPVDGPTRSVSSPVNPAFVAEMLTLLVQRGWSVDARDRKGRTALMLAASENNTELIRLLLEGGAQVDLPCECPDSYLDHKSALVMASEKGFKYSARLLLDAGAQVSESDGGGSPLVFAAENGSTKAVERLLRMGADPNKPFKPGGDTALMFASEHGSLEMVTLLLAAGANVNAENEIGATALIWAATLRERGAVIEKLLDSGAEINRTNNLGRSALMIAASNGDVGTARLLLQRGADIDLIDRDNMSAYAHATKIKDAGEKTHMLGLLSRKKPHEESK